MAFDMERFIADCRSALTADLAQKAFERAVAMLHSFFFPETINAFNKVAEVDPACAKRVPSR